MTIRALVCDDDLPIRKMVRDILENRSVEVVEAANGLEAMAIFSEEHIDLVVTDFLMPKVDGMQVVNAIRTSARPEVPIVLMSAISKGHIEPNESDFRPDFYIAKPFKPRKMSKLLDSIIEKL